MLPGAADRRAAAVTGEGKLDDHGGEVVGQDAADGKPYVVDFESTSRWAPRPGVAVDRAGKRDP